MAAPALLLGCPPARVLTETILEEIASRDGGRVIQLCPAEFRTFPNGEVYAHIIESVRGRHAVVVQCPCAYRGKSVNDALMEVKLACDALFRASVAGITVVLTEFPYQRQDRKDDPREPISAKRVAVEIERALGSVPERRVVSVDLHQPAIQGFFEIPFDALTASTELAPKVGAAGYTLVVSPDAGGTKRAERFAQLLASAVPEGQRVDMDLIWKRRLGPDAVEEIPWAISKKAFGGRHAVIVDDILATGGTARVAAAKCREFGAKRVALAVTHAECSQNAWERLGPEVFDDIFITDSLPLDRLPHPLPAHWHVVSLAPLLAEAIVRIVTGQSVSELEQRRHQRVAARAGAPSVVP